VGGRKKLGFGGDMLGSELDIVAGGGMGVECTLGCNTPPYI